MTPNQLELFDLEDFEREHVAITPWHGAPLTYTTDYYSPTELDAAFERYKAEFGHHGSIPRSHMWYPQYATPVLVARVHELHVYTADTRCTYGDHDHSDNPLPNGFPAQAICPPCRWHHINDETAAVFAWHDHAMPGWRDLPVYPEEIDRFNNKNWIKKTRSWAETNYPAPWIFDGAPIISVRTDRRAGRATPRYSPFGGYDIAAHALDR